MHDGIAFFGLLAVALAADSVGPTGSLAAVGILTAIRLLTGIKKSAPRWTRPEDGTETYCNHTISHRAPERKCVLRRHRTFCPSHTER